MRIVYYVLGWPPDRFPNGVVSATASLAPAIRQAGHEAQILSYYGEPDGDATVSYVHAAVGPGIPVLRALMSRIAPRQETLDAAPRNIARRLNEAPELAGADIVEMEESFGWSRIVAARIAAPVVTRLHGPYFLTGAAERDEQSFSAFETQRVRREGVAIKTAAAITAPSRFVLDAVRNRYDCALPHAAIVPNAARAVNDSKGWRLAEADGNEILFVGRFDRIKGADILLRAFAMVAARRPTLRLTFAGPIQHPMHVDGEAVEAIDFVRTLMPPDAAARVNFLGLAPNSTLGELRRRALLTVVASRIEVFANVVLEALAHGCPVVATRVGGIPEIVRDGVEAALVEPESPAALAAGIETLLAQPEYAAQLGETGRRRVRSEYAPERVAALAIEHYRETLARERVPQQRAGGD